MLHLLAFTKASAGGVTLEDVPGVQDAWAALNAASHYLLPQDMLVKMAAALSPNATLAQISAPHFREVAIPAIAPLDIGTAFTSLPAINWYENPFVKIYQNDELTTLETDNAGAGIQKYAFLLLMDAYLRNVPQGKIYTLRATATVTGGNKSWVAGTATFDQTIPVGTYAVVGMDAVGAGLLAARLIFPGGGTRPGCLARVSEATKPDQGFRMGRLGEWGRFTNTAPPSFEFFGNAALTAETVYLDVVKVSG